MCWLGLVGWWLDGGGKSEREALAKYKTVTVGMILNYDARQSQWHLAQMAAETPLFTHANLHSASLVEFTSHMFTHMPGESSSLQVSVVVS